MFQHEENKNQEEQQHRHRSQDDVGGREMNPCSEPGAAGTTIRTMHSKTAPSSAAAAAFYSARMWNGGKYMMALAFFCDAVLRLQGRSLYRTSSVASSISTTTAGTTRTLTAGKDESWYSPIMHDPHRRRRRLVLQEAIVEGSSNNSNNSISVIDKTAAAAAAAPSYMQPLFADLRERQKLFIDTPPEEIKYWFEYTGPMQVRLIIYGYRKEALGSSSSCFCLPCFNLLLTIVFFFLAFLEVLLSVFQNAIQSRLF
jgi:hypothetical protein